MRFWRWLFRRRTPRSTRRSLDSPYRTAASKLPGAPPPEPLASSPPPAPPAAEVSPRRARSDVSFWRRLLVVGGIIAMRSGSGASPTSDNPRYPPLPTAPAVALPRAWSPPSPAMPPWSIDPSTVEAPTAAITSRWALPAPTLKWNPVPFESADPGMAKPIDTPTPAVSATSRQLQAAPADRR